MNQHNDISKALFEKIERYICDDMDPDERQEFTVRLQNDPTLREQVNEMRILFDSIEAQSFQEKMDEFHSDIPGSTIKDPVPHRNLITLNYKSIAIAASIILLLGLGGYWIFYQNSPKALYATYFNPDPGLSTVMGSSDDYPFYDAMVNYKYGDYSLALSKWNEQLEAKPRNDTLNYFIGVTKMALKDTNAAIPNFEKVVEQSSSNFYNEAQFYLGLAFLKNDDMKNALKHLKKSDIKEASELIIELEKQ